VADEGRVDSLLRESMASGLGEVPVIVLLEGEGGLGIFSHIMGGADHHYSIVPGFSGTLDAREIEYLSSQPGVKKIFFDRTYQILPTSPQSPGIQLDVSVDSINAGYVQDTLNYTGRNITVAVIDTGVDYTHPDLGGCTSIQFLAGNCSRFAGGYDFFYDEANPNDVNGHGTHVAGIIGANGAITGVAPEVRFLAYAVCNAVGDDCPESDIIAAVDAAYADGADIISMSLGEMFQPTDGVGALEFALEAAVARGVFAAVAAGNAGPGTGCINSPGEAESVVAVGASYDLGTTDRSDDTIWDRSCRGPSAWGRLDPDLVAPGKSIHSTWWPGHGYRVLEGTSMATPHVSGAAALMLEADSSLTPAIIRSRLMHSATTMGYNVFDEGAGLINARSAIEYVLDADVSGSDRWEVSLLPGGKARANLTVQNRGNASVTVNLSSSSFSDKEGTADITSDYMILPESFTVNASSNKTVGIYFRAPENAIPAVYGGALTVSASNNQTLRVPVAVSVPLFGGGAISGTVNDWVEDVYKRGDWIYYPLKNTGGLSLINVSLNWSNNSSNLDLYLYAPNGVLEGYSNQTSGNLEETGKHNPTYTTYWAAVHAKTLTAAETFQLTVTYSAPTVTVSPQRFAGVISNNSNNITFTLENDETPKENVSVSVKVRVNGTQTSYIINGSIEMGNASHYVCLDSWFIRDRNLTLTNARYLDVSIQWNSTQNLDIYLQVWNDTGDGIVNESEILKTAYTSQNNNRELGLNVEELADVDALSFIRDYNDTGLAIYNMMDNETFNGTVTVNATFYDMGAFPPASPDKSQINLSANETENITVSFNTSQLALGEIYQPTLYVGEYARVPLTVEYGVAHDIVLSLTPLWNLISFPVFI